MTTYSVTEIPLSVDSPNYSLTVTLDETEYLLRFDYNQRLDRWYLHLYSKEGAALRVGMKVVCNWDVLRRTCAPRPRGALIFSDLADLANAPPPGFADLGRRVRLLYVTPNPETPPRVTTPVVPI